MFGRTETYHYHVCLMCKASYHHPMPRPSAIVGFYPSEYSIYRQPARAKNVGNLEKAVLRYKYGYSHLHVPTLYRFFAPVVALWAYRDAIVYAYPGRLLEIGCGNGQFLLRLKQLGWECEGIDFNEVAVKICRSQGLKVYHGDLESAGLGDCSYDIIMASHVIEHLPNPDTFFREVARILKPKPGHQLIIKTPNSEALGRKWFGKYWFANDVPRHLILFSPYNLDILATRHGLRRIQLQLNTTPKYILNSIDYRFGNKGKPSKKCKGRRLLAKIYVLAAKLTGKGDEIRAVYEKP